MRLETSVEIDIRPGSQKNNMNPESNGLVPVAVLSSTDFDAFAQMDRTSLKFGRTGDEPSLAECSPEPLDVNGDGLNDLVCRFLARLSGFVPGDTGGTLRGATLDGVPIVGKDSIRLVPPKRN